MKVRPPQLLHLLGLLIILMTLNAHTSTRTHTKIAEKNILTQNCNKLNENPNGHVVVGDSQPPGHAEAQTNFRQVCSSSNSNNNSSTSATSDSNKCSTQIVAMGGAQQQVASAATPTLTHMRAAAADLLWPGGDFYARAGGGVHAQCAVARTKVANRRKRFIIFNGFGVIKLVLGISFPVTLANKKRSLNYVYNFHLQYLPPPRPIYWWSFYNTSAFAARRTYRAFRAAPSPALQTGNNYATLTKDTSREYVYAIIESIFERAGLPGTACLLKAICDVSRTPFHASNRKRNAGNTSISAVLHALLNAIFTPILPNVQANYWQAHQEGQHRADCAQIYNECNGNKHWLQRFSLYI